MIELSYLSGGYFGVPHPEAGKVGAPKFIALHGVEVFQVFMAWLVFCQEAKS